MSTGFKSNVHSGTFKLISFIQLIALNSACGLPPNQSDLAR